MAKHQQEGIQAHGLGWAVVCQALTPIGPGACPRLHGQRQHRQGITVQLVAVLLRRFVAHS